MIGPNGAGKTTLFNMVSGFSAPDRGTITFRGQPIHGRPPHQVAARGLSRTFQNIRLFEHMTALENVMVGRHLRGRAGFLAGMLDLGWTRRETAAVRARSLQAMAFLGIEALADAEATSLAYGQQRAVELARALASDPEMRAPRRAGRRPQHAGDARPGRPHHPHPRPTASPSCWWSTTCRW